MKKQTSFIADSFILYGNLEVEEDLRIDGIISGHIQCGHTLTIGEKARIDGNIVADSLNSSGQINGNIKTQKKVYLTEQSSFLGEIQSQDIEIEDYATFQGSIKVI